MFFGVPQAYCKKGPERTPRSPWVLSGTRTHLVRVQNHWECNPNPLPGPAQVSCAIAVRSQTCHFSGRSASTRTRAGLHVLSAGPGGLKVRLILQAWHRHSRRVAGGGMGWRDRWNGAGGGREWEGLWTAWPKEGGGDWTWPLDQILTSVPSFGCLKLHHLFWQCSSE